MVSRDGRSCGKTEKGLQATERRGENRKRRKGKARSGGDGDGGCRNRRNGVGWMMSKYCYIFDDGWMNCCGLALVLRFVARIAACHASGDIAQRKDRSGKLASHGSREQRG